MKYHSHNATPSLISNRSTHEGEKASILAALEDDSASKADKRRFGRFGIKTKIAAIAGMLVVAIVYAALSIRNTLPKTVPEKVEPGNLTAKQMTSQPPATAPVALESEKGTAAHIEVSAPDNPKPDIAKNTASPAPTETTHEDQQKSLIAVSEKTGLPAIESNGLSSANVNAPKPSAIKSDSVSMKDMPTSSRAAARSQPNRAIRDKYHTNTTTIPARKPSSKSRQDADEEILAALLTRVIPEDKK